MNKFDKDCGAHLLLGEKEGRVAGLIAVENGLELDWSDLLRRLLGQLSVQLGVDHHFGEVFVERCDVAELFEVEHLVANDDFHAFDFVLLS